MIEKIGHYSLTSPASVYDEEALTALELAGRTAGKVNEAIGAFNKLEEDTGDRLQKQDDEIKNQKDEVIPKKIKDEVQKQINNGTFDKQISDYAGGLEERVDNLLANIPEGGTTMDAEVVDIRTGYDGKIYPNAGEAVREQSRLSKTVKDNVLAPIYGEVIAPTSVTDGNYFKPDTGLMMHTVGASYGVAIFEVEKGKEYKCAFKYNSAEPYQTMVIGDDAILTGTISNPVPQATKTDSFIASKTGYLYVNYNEVFDGAETLRIVEVVGYQNASSIDLSKERVKVTVPFTIAEGYGLSAYENPDIIKLIQSENYDVFQGYLDPGIYDMLGNTKLTGTPLTDECYIPLEASYSGATNVVLNRGYYFTSFTMPPIRHYEVNSDKQARAMTEASINATYITGDEITGELTPWYGLINANSGQIGKIAETYNFMSFPVEKDKEYVLSCEAYSFPSATYPLYALCGSKDIGELSSLYVEASSLGAVSGKFEHIVKPNFDGFLLVSHNEKAPSDIKLHTLKTASYTSNASGSNSSYKKLLTVGDSLSGNGGLWQAECIKLLGVPEYTTAGGAGLTLADQGSDVNTIYNRVMGLTKDAKVDLITLWGGVNDWSAGITISTLADQLDVTKRDSKTFAGGALDCVEKLLTLYPTAQIVMLGTTPFDMYNSSGEWQTALNRNNNTIKDFVKVFEDIANHYSIPFYNLLENSGFNKKNYATYYMEQGYWLHPNSLGNMRLAKLISGFIKTLG